MLVQLYKHLNENQMVGVVNRAPVGKLDLQIPTKMLQKEIQGVVQVKLQTTICSSSFQL
ncbi:hypothetical protein Leryth_011881 [Lithospermum erythrorhizon]|nr:hypothetical protein Leryth_011881 [Lithospermum erythrorhizon]